MDAVYCSSRIWSTRRDGWISYDEFLNVNSNECEHSDDETKRPCRHLLGPWALDQRAAGIVQSGATDAHAPAHLPPPVIRFLLSPVVSTGQAEVIRYSADSVTDNCMGRLYMYVS
ncbi:hypothetical protein J6590_025506 [Homalodisca vitripennis]|nr:hypothetical protein J6590_025506 [Homalodisca vitripennis]